MVVIMVGIVAMQVVVVMRVGMGVSVWVRVIMGMGVGVRMCVHQITMPVHVIVMMGVLMRMAMLVLVIMRRVMRMAVVAMHVVLLQIRPSPWAFASPDPCGGDARTRDLSSLYAGSRRLSRIERTQPFLTRTWLCGRLSAPCAWVS